MFLRKSYFKSGIAALLVLVSQCLPAAALSYPQRDQALGIAMSPDGQFAAAGHLPFEGDESRKGAREYIQSYDLVRVWKVRTGEQYRVYPTRNAVVAFSPDSQSIAVVNGETVDIIHMATDRRLHKLQTKLLPSRCRFSPDGAWLILETGRDRSLKDAYSANPKSEDYFREVELWNLTPEPTVIRQTVRGYSYRIHYSRPGGAEISTVPQKEERSPLNSCTIDFHPEGRLKSEAFSPDGLYQAIQYSKLGDRDKESPIRIYGPNSCEPLQTLQGPVGYLWFSPSAKHLLSAASLQLRVWNLETGTQQQISLNPKGEPSSISESRTAFSADESLIVIANRFSYHETNKNRPVLFVYNLQTGKLVSELR